MSQHNQQTQHNVVPVQLILFPWMKPYPKGHGRGPIQPFFGNGTLFSKPSTSLEQWLTQPPSNSEPLRHERPNLRD